MTPYYENASVAIYHGDSREILPAVRNGALVVTDPPYNMGYRYDTYIDNLALSQYLELLKVTVSGPSIVIHYPDGMFRVAFALQMAPNESVAWVYHANTPRQWRMVSWFGCEPDFSLQKQSYKNLTDKRILKLLAAGAAGPNLYNWWHVEQVKNVSHEKTPHPCQIPLLIMERALAITACETVVDPFMGSGTTLEAAMRCSRRAIGIDISEQYCEIAAKRLARYLPFAEVSE